MNTGQIIALVVVVLVMLVVLAVKFGINVADLIPCCFCWLD